MGQYCTLTACILARHTLCDTHYAILHSCKPENVNIANDPTQQLIHIHVRTRQHSNAHVPKTNTHKIYTHVCKHSKWKRSEVSKPIIHRTNYLSDIIESAGECGERLCPNRATTTKEDGTRRRGRLAAVSKHRLNELPRSLRCIALHHGGKEWEEGGSGGREGVEGGRFIVWVECRER